MTQQFFVGDVVEVVEVDTDLLSVSKNWYDVGDKFVVAGWNDGAYTSSECPNHITVEGEDKGVWVQAKHVRILTRAWQKNTGIQPIEDGIEVLVKRTDSTIDRAEACMFDWYAGDIGSIVEWRIADSVSSGKEQPEGVPPSHVALGEELAAVDATPTSVSTEQDFVNSPKHYAFFDGVEAIEIIASSMSVEAFRGYCMGNALKYRLRVGKKDKVEQEIAKADKYGELFEKHKHLCKGEK